MTRVLAVDDDAATRRALASIIRSSGCEPVVTPSGDEAYAVLTGGNAPSIALVDWLMPGVGGIDLVRRVRETPLALQPYIIVLTVKSASRDIVAGLDAGADDYMVKPANTAELQARVRVGLRTLELQQRLSQRVAALEAAASHVRQLQSLLPICSYCRRIRDDGDYWKSLEEYLATHAEVKFTHGCCPECYETHVRPELAAYEEAHAASRP
jgi:DNA-binding response OmpR family regulator